jgi:hypothetical protein
MKRKTKNKEHFIGTILVFSIFFLFLISNIKISFAAENNNSLLIPLNFQTSEFSDKKGTINNASSIEIELPSSTWNITHVELNFTDIEYFMREIKIIEDTPIKDDLFLEKHGLEELGVQIKLNKTTSVCGVYMNIKTSTPHTMDGVTVQLRGFNPLINAPNSSIYGSVDLNHTIIDGWNYQNFNSTTMLPKGNYYLVMRGLVHASGIYRWYYNNLNPNNPDLYRSENHGSGWINGTQGSPFLYKLVQKIRERDIYPEKYNMTAEINGKHRKILNGTHIGSGILQLAGIDFSPHKEILYIPIMTGDFFFNLSYHLKLKNQFPTPVFVNITENEDNFWKIIPNINRCNYNYSIKIKLPNNFYNLIVLKDGIDVTSYADIVITGNILSILNDTINADATWEITVNSPKVDLTLDISRGTEFELGQELIFSIVAPIREGNYTVILYNEFEAELDRKIIPVVSDETIYAFNITTSASLGNWTAFVYWNSHADASVQYQVFTIIPISQNSSLTPPLPDLNPILVLVIIIGGVLGGGTLASLTIIKTIKRKKRKNELEIQKVSNKFKDILSLSYLMVSDIKSGVNVYEQSFAGKTMDPSLISGFLDAMRNFGIELTGSYSKSETITLDYQDSIIIMNESEDFRIIIIMSDKPSEELTNSITNLAINIEEKFGDLLREFKGGVVTQFAGIKELIELHLNVSFASPLRIAITKKGKLNPFEKAVVQKAKEIMSQTNLNYFYSTFLMPDQLFDVEMTKVIFNLINRKIFQPIELD